ncbi:MAG: DUF2339 domain-containing protein [Patescibacteria group bacterium]|nr:DUF2339 domain-containing protein [Patescibacteria group bacterium]
MEAILLVIIIILLFWNSSLSSRIGRLERQSQSNQPPAKQSDLAPQDYQRLEAHKDVFAASSEPPAKIEPAAQPASLPEPTAASQQNISPYAWLTRIGILAIALGVVFFYKYAIDQGWISEWMRVCFGFAVGGLFVVLGELWKNKYPKYAYAISGGGILILDFTIFAAFNFYSLFPQALAIGLMAMVSALAVWLSIKRNSLALAVLGIAGAYAAPVLLSTGSNQQGLWLTYVTLLNVAVLAVGFRKFWVELLTFAFIGSVVVFGIWAAAFSTTANTWGSVAFVAVTTALLVFAGAIEFRRHYSSEQPGHSLDKNFGLFTILCGLFYYMSAYLLLDQNFHSYLPLLALLGAVIYWFSYVLVDRLDQYNTNYALSFWGTAFVVAAAYWQFSGRTFDAVLIAIAVISAILGYVVKRREFSTWGLVALYVSLLKVAFEPYQATDTQFLLNGKFALMFLETAAMVLVGWLSAKISAGGDKAMQLSEIVAGILLWIALSLDITHAYNGLGASQGLGLWWVIYPPVLAWLAYIGKRKALAGVALAMLFLGALKVLFMPYDNATYALLFNAKFGLMFLATIGFLLVSLLHNQKDNKPGDASLADVLKISASLNLWFAVSWEIVQFYSFGGSENVRNLLLSLWWMVYGVVLMVVSPVKGFGVYRQVAIIFFSLAIAKVFLYDVAALETGYRIVSFIVLGVILLSVSFAYQKNKEKIVGFLKGDNVVNKSNEK